MNLSQENFKISMDKAYGNKESASKLSKAEYDVRQNFADAYFKIEGTKEEVIKAFNYRLTLDLKLRNR